MRLLVVNNEKPLAQTVQRGLARHYVIDVVESGKEALFQALTHEYAAIILNLQLSDIPGLDLCRELRHHGIPFPILAFSDKNSTEQKVLLFNAGADDYMVRPFSLAELQARLRALLRRGTTISPQLVEAGGLQLDKLAQVVSYKGKPLPLTRKELLICEYLLKHPNKVVSRFELLEHIWEKEPETLGSNTIDVHINTLRNKIGRPHSASLIKTVHGSGYQLIAFNSSS